MIDPFERRITIVKINTSITKDTSAVSLSNFVTGTKPKNRGV